jgi:type I restriction enzyme S subunit
VSWPIVRLQDVAFFQEGPGVRKWQFRTEGVKLINVKNIVDNILNTDNSNKFLDPEEVKEKYSHFLVDSGDLVMASSGATWGKTAWVEDKHLPLCMNTSMIRFKSLDEKKLSIKYLSYFLKTEDFTRVMERLITGSAQPNFGSSHLKQVEIPLPPLAEQKRSAAILDKADAIRRKRQKAIQLADDFLRAVFLDMFGDPVANPKGWEVVELQDLIASKDKLNYGVVQPGEHDENGVPLIRSGDLSDRTPEVEGLRRVSEKIDLKHKKSRLVGNEILIACVGSIGRVGWVSDDMVGWNIARAVTRIPIKESVNREYIYRYLQSPVVQGYFERETRAVAQPTLNVGLIAKTPIALPPSELQNDFLKKYSKIKLYKDRLGEQLLDQEKLIASLSQKAFRGEL